MHLVTQDVKAKMDAFVSTYMQPSSKISFILCTTGKEIVEKNRRFLTSIVKCLEFCERHGVTLRSHRDESTAPDKRQQGNFKGILDFHVDAGDQVLPGTSRNVQQKSIIHLQNNTK